MNDMEAFSLRTQIVALHDRAKSEYDNGKYQAAESLLEQACELARGADDLDLLVHLRISLSEVQKILGKNSEALAAMSWLIGIATDPATSGRLREERSLENLAGSFASFTDNARHLPSSDLDDLLRVLREGEAWMVRIGKPGWTADLRIQRGLILKSQGDIQGARREMEASLAMKRRQRPLFGFTFETHLFQLASLLMDEPFKEYETALVLTDEILESLDCRYYELLRAYKIRSHCHEKVGDLDGAEQDAREMVSLARQGDQIGDSCEALGMLGRLLLMREHHQEGLAMFREAVALIDDEDVSFSRIANSCAWQMYLTSVNLDEAADLARRAWQNDPANTNVLQTLAAILVRQDRWEEAAELTREWSGRADRQYLSSQWHNDLLLFQDALKHGHAEALAGMLNQNIWEPMRVAMVKAAREDNDLSDVPERLREAVAALLTQLRGGDVPLAYPTFEGPSP
jgi:tetratricopeptide (TPR) repeat protein